jgi:hypothetical protein
LKPVDKKLKIMTDFTICESFLKQLADTENFTAHFKQFLTLSNPYNHNNLISKVFVHIRNILELYENIGYENIQRVYTGIDNLPDISFPQSTHWNICTLTGVVCRNCFCINNEIYLAAEYKPWMFAVWTLTHILTIEKLRKQNKGIHDEILDRHIHTYQQCALLVLNSLLDVFPSILFRTQYMKEQLSSL